MQEPYRKGEETPLWPRVLRCRACLAVSEGRPSKLLSTSHKVSDLSLTSHHFGRRNNEIQMPRFESSDFEKQKGISPFAGCSRRGHSRGVRHRFGLSSFGPGPLATTQRGSRVPERERLRHDENDE